MRFTNENVVKMSEEKNKNIIRKVAELSRRISACDWTPDSGYSIKGRTIQYVSGSKIKRQIRPILNEMGILFMFRIADIQQVAACGIKENHVIIRGFVSLVDADTGESLEYAVISEGADAGDKAVLSGISYAKRIFWITNFDIIDGMEGMEVEGNVSSSDVAANLMRSAIPEASAPTQPEAPQQSGASVHVTSPNEGGIAKMQIKAMDNALETIKRAVDEGKVMSEYYEKAMEIRKRASCREDVQAILNIKAELDL